MSAITHFNNFPIANYIFTLDASIVMTQAKMDFDDAQFDPLYCGLVVALILARERLGVSISSLAFCQSDGNKNKNEEEALEVDSVTTCNRNYLTIDKFAEQISR